MELVYNCLACEAVGRLCAGRGRRWAGCGKTLGFSRTCFTVLENPVFPWAVHGLPRAVHGLSTVSRQLCTNPRRVPALAAACMQPVQCTKQARLFPPGCVELSGGRRGCENKRNTMETFWGNESYLAFGILRMLYSV